MSPSKSGPESVYFYLAVQYSWSILPPPPPIWVLFLPKVEVVGFVLKELLTYFKMLNVPHALHCVDRCIFVFDLN